MRKSIASALAALLLASGSGVALAATQLTGAGSSFVYPFFSKAFYEYSKTHGDVTVNYQSIGSGGGIAQFTQKTVDFGASDVPMNPDELKRAGGADDVLQIPVALGGVSVVYNLPGVSNGLRLTSELVADIYLGKVTKWNDPQIAKLNAGTKLPDMPIVVVHRSDGSGTSYIFTDFLSSVSSEWKSKVGTGKSVSWPAPSSVGGKGNEGVAGQVNNSPGAIGYTELAYAKQNHLNSAALQNKAGKFVNDAEASVKAAAATKPNVNPSDFSIVNSNCAACYPIAGYTWVMVYKNMQDKGRAKLVHDVLEYVVGADAQKIAGSLDYVPLPDNVSDSAKATLKKMAI